MLEGEHGRVETSDPQLSYDTNFELYHIRNWVHPSQCRSSNTGSEHSAEAQCRSQQKRVKGP